MKIGSRGKRPRKSFAEVLAGVETDIAAAVADIVAHRPVERQTRRRRRTSAEPARAA